MEFRKRYGIRGRIEHVFPHPDGGSTVWTRSGAHRVAEPLERVLIALRLR